MAIFIKIIGVSSLKLNNLADFKPKMQLTHADSEHHGRLLQLNSGFDYQISPNNKMSYQLSVHNESEQLLGSYGVGVFGLKSSNLLFHKFAWAYQVANSLLSAQVKIGRGSANGANYISAINKIKTSSFALQSTTTINKKHLLVAKISSPTKIDSANISLNLPSARTLTGDVIYQKYNTAFKSSARQINFELASRYKINKNESLQVKLLHIKNPNHIANQDDIRAVAIKYKKSF